MSKSVSVKFPWESTQIVDTGVALTPPRLFLRRYKSLVFSGGLFIDRSAGIPNDESENEPKRR